MNINYHYYAIKTLALFAGYHESAAQCIAHFSQQVDNYTLCNPILIKNKPPDFFLKNQLAKPIGKNIWVFFPCQTGINVLTAISHKNQLHTVMPFHFITKVPFNELSMNSDRSEYRCMEAEKDERLLINKLARQVMKRVDIKDEKTLIELGMMLHTYADTYAHSNYSGFHGWENESYVVKAYDKSENADAMNSAEILLYKTLPSIGHANVGHAPDVCDCTIILAMKKDKNARLEPFIKRDNTDFFAQCSKNILKMLCEVNHYSIPDEETLNEIFRRIEKAQYVKSETNVEELNKSWSVAFPGFHYSYNKKEYFNISMFAEKCNYDLLKHIEVNEEQLLDVYSEEGDKARAFNLVYLKGVNDYFFKYNEFAYQRVFAVTGEYVSKGEVDILRLYTNMAGDYYSEK